MKCLEKDPAKRFQSVTAFFEALEAADDQGVPEPFANEGELATGVGVHVVLQPRQDTDELDEELCDDIQQVLDHAEDALTNAGFAMVLATGSLLLAICLLPEEKNERIVQEKEAKAKIFDLRERLTAQAAEKDRMEITISMRVDQVYVKKGTEIQFLGGPLLHTDDWTNLPDTMVEGEFRGMASTCFAAL